MRMEMSNSTNEKQSAAPTKGDRWLWHGWRGRILALTGIMTLLLPGCGSEPQKPEVPQFPVYEPAARFLALQDRVREWARDIEEKRETEVVLNIIKGRNKYYRAWKPIYDRIEDHKRNPNRPRK